MTKKKDLLAAVRRTIKRIDDQLVRKMPRKIQGASVMRFCRAIVASAAHETEEIKLARYILGLNVQLQRALLTIAKIKYDGRTIKRNRRSAVA